MADAEFPVYYTSRSLPGQSTQVPGRLDVRTGEAAVAAAWGDLADSGFRWGSTEHRLQGVAELVDLSAEDSESLRQLSLKLQANTDESTYDQYFNETWGEISGRKVKNGWARRQRALALPTMRQQALKDIDNAKRQRVVENHKEAIALVEAKAIQSGSTRNVEALLQSAVNAGLMSKEGMEAEMIKVGHRVEMEAFQRWALESPEEALADLEDNKLEGAVHLDTDDYRRLREVAQGSKAGRETKLEEKRATMTQELWGISQKVGTDVDDILAHINALPDEYFDADARDKLLRQTMSRIGLIRRDRGDPLEVRQDYAKYKELLFATIDGRAKESQVREAVNNNQITIGDYVQLVNLMRAHTATQASAYDLSAVLKRMDSLIDESVLIFKDMKETAKIKGMMQLESRIKAAAEQGKPLVGPNLMLEMLRVERAIEEEALGAGTPGELLPIQSLPRPKTKAEYDALPKGTRYIHPRYGVMEKL